MSQFEELVEQYWRYYRAPEDRLLGTERYVEFDYTNNGKVYSMEYMMLFQTICSEIDVVGKAYAKLCNSSFTATKYTGINEWWFYITQSKPDILSAECTFRSRNILQPWKSYVVIRNPNSVGKKYILDTSKCAATPNWWNAYNGAKHDRTKNKGTNYRGANFRNVLNAMAALYILETQMLSDSFDARMDSQLGVLMESQLFGDRQVFYSELIFASSRGQKLVEPIKYYRWSNR